MSKPEESEIHETILDSVDQIFDELRLSNRRIFGDGLRSPWLFRGHRDPPWRLIPAVFRPDFLEIYKRPNVIFRKMAEKSIKTNRITKHPWISILGEDQEKRLIDLVERLMTEYQLLRVFNFAAFDLGLLPEQHWPPISERLKPDASILLDDPVHNERTIPQHYGVPTRLLDWTSHPLTALFFALVKAQTVDCTVTAFDADGYVRHLNQLPERTSAPYVELKYGDRALNAYLRAQDGAFSFIRGGELAFVKTGQYPSVDQLVPPHLIKNFRIRLTADDQKLAMAMLYKERRTVAHLHPDFGGCAQLAVSSLMNGFML